MSETIKAKISAFPSPLFYVSASKTINGQKKERSELEPISKTVRDCY